jgi:hypothetical protein
MTRTSFNTVAHDAAHGTLIAVRAAERNLTQAVSALRTRRENAPSFSRKEKAAESLQAPARPMSDILRKQTEEVD